MTVKLNGKAVDVMCTTNKKYEKFVTVQKGRKIIYLKLLMVSYVCIHSALLLYNTYINNLAKDGFVLNRYYGGYGFLTRS